MLCAPLLLRQFSYGFVIFESEEVAMKVKREGKMSFMGKTVGSSVGRANPLTLILSNATCACCTAFFLCR
jgi:hypothetical protein